MQEVASGAFGESVASLPVIQRTAPEATRSKPTSGGITACVDVGGTFVDLALFDRLGAVAFHKVLNTPAAPESAVLDGLAELLSMSTHSPHDLADVIYSTTLGVNAVIERKGAAIALLTTKGFRDVTEIRTEQPYDLYNPFGRFPEPIVPRAWRLAIDERTLADGTILRRPGREEIAEIAAKLRQGNVQAAAICFIHSYANSANEEQVAAWLKAELPNCDISLSSRVMPQLGEYPRFSTTAINAYMLPLIKRHLAALDEGLRHIGFAGRLLVVSSAGGMMAWPVAAEFPVKLLESGPAAGAVGISTLKRSMPSVARDLIITLDMGGTTAKTSIITERGPLITTEHEVGRVERFKRGSGLLVGLPTIDIIEVGAGGGSIAHVDLGGLLVVGPHSSGADPGPACYGRGGDLPTVTDADLLLGYLNPDHFLGGRMRLYPDRARDAIQRHVADALSFDVERAAAGIFKVVNANMAQAVGVHAAEKGLNARRCAFVAIGGAAPVHAWAVARELGLQRLFMPFKAGIFSAMGCRTVPPAFDQVTSYRSPLAEVDPGRVAEIYEQMKEECIAGLEGAAHCEQIRLFYAVDLQYSGQRSTVTIPFECTDGRVDNQTLRDCLTAFEAAYDQLYGRRITGVPVEAITWRLRAVEQSDQRWPRMLREQPQPPELVSVPGQRRVHFEGVGWLTAEVRHRTALTDGQQLIGPSIVEDIETTMVVPPGATATVFGELGLEVELGH